MSGGDRRPDRASSAELTALLVHLDGERRHVLAAAEGLREVDLTRPVAPSGWSMAQMLHHLTYDDEIFWAGAVLGADAECIALLRDGWSEPVTSGAEAVDLYRRWTLRTSTALASVDLDAPPRWWPPANVFPFPPFAEARSCVLRLLLETATHAGHLDLARERLDGHQHLVVR
nr:DUF664 domain-containing protein [uncultured Actinotalea sp.]